jgi:hypothetical protein
MNYANTSSFTEVLKSQIEAEFNNYRTALNTNKEIWELKQIKDKIKKLQNTLNSIMNNLRNSFPENSVAS